jgi:NAD(P)-dependent dehydrogenase (short-subunit alcohol dehydrogenase family)
MNPAAEVESRERTSLEGLVAIVTGAGNGIGAETSRLLARRGARVVVADIDSAAGGSTVDEIVATGGSAILSVADISAQDQVEATFAAAHEAYGRLDVLVNNAAALNLIAGDRLAAELDLENAKRTFEVNVAGVMAMTRAALRTMVPQRSGSIINFSSASSMGGEFGLTAYGASKAAVNQYTRAVATQYGRYGIRCNAIAPGLVNSKSGRVTPERLEKYRRHHVTPDIGKPSDVAEVVAFFASEASSFVTGQVLAVDGGATAHLSWAAEDLPAL